MRPNTPGFIPLTQDEDEGEGVSTHWVSIESIKMISDASVTFGSPEWAQTSITIGHLVFLHVKETVAEVRYLIRHATDEGRP